MSTEKSKNVVVTKKARENLVKARAGAITLPKIIGMAFGEGRCKQFRYGHCADGISV